MTGSGEHESHRVPVSAFAAALSEGFCPDCFVPLIPHTNLGYCPACHGYWGRNTEPASPRPVTEAAKRRAEE